MDSEQQPCGPKTGQPIDRKEDRSSQRRISLEVGVVGTDIREDSGGRHSVFLVEVRFGKLIWVVEKRFKDFYAFDAQLRKQLASREHIGILPPLPRKVVPSIAIDNALRVQQLDIYLKAICVHITAALASRAHKNDGRRADTRHGTAGEAVLVTLLQHLNAFVNFKDHSGHVCNGTQQDAVALACTPGTLDGLTNDHILLKSDARAAHNSPKLHALDGHVGTSTNASGGLAFLSKLTPQVTDEDEYELLMATEAELRKLTEQLSDAVHRVQADTDTKKSLGQQVVSARERTAALGARVQLGQAQHAEGLKGTGAAESAARELALLARRLDAAACALVTALHPSRSAPASPTPSRGGGGVEGGGGTGAVESPGKEVGVRAREEGTCGGEGDGTMSARVWDAQGSDERATTSGSSRGDGAADGHGASNDDGFEGGNTIGIEQGNPRGADAAANAVVMEELRAVEKAAAFMAHRGPASCGWRRVGGGRGGSGVRLGRLLLSVQAARVLAENAALWRGIAECLDAHRRLSCYLARNRFGEPSTCFGEPWAAAESEAKGSQGESPGGSLTRAGSGSGSGSQSRAAGSVGGGDDCGGAIGGSYKSESSFSSLVSGRSNTMSPKLSEEAVGAAPRPLQQSITELTSIMSAVYAESKTRLPSISATGSSQVASSGASSESKAAIRQAEFTPLGRLESAADGYGMEGPGNARWNENEDSKGVDGGCECARGAGAGGLAGGAGATEDKDGGRAQAHACDYVGKEVGEEGRREGNGESDEEDEAGAVGGQGASASNDKEEDKEDPGGGVHRIGPDGGGCEEGVEADCSDSSLLLAAEVSSWGDPGAKEEAAAEAVVEAEEEKVVVVEAEREEEEEEMLRCWHCDARDVEMQRCSKCKSVWYCSRACQAADWVGGHRAECAEMAERRSHPPVASLAQNVSAPGACAESRGNGESEGGIHGAGAVGAKTEVGIGVDGESRSDEERHKGVGDKQQIVPKVGGRAVVPAEEEAAEWTARGDAEARDEERRHGGRERRWQAGDEAGVERCADRSEEAAEEEAVALGGSQVWDSAARRGKGFHIMSPPEGYDDPDLVKPLAGCRDTDLVNPVAGYNDPDLVNPVTVRHQLFPPPQQEQLQHVDHSDASKTRGSRFSRACPSGAHDHELLVEGGRADEAGKTDGVHASTSASEPSGFSDPDLVCRVMACGGGAAGREREAEAGPGSWQSVDTCRKGQTEAKDLVWEFEPYTGCGVDAVPVVEGAAKQLEEKFMFVATMLSSERARLCEELRLHRSLRVAMRTAEARLEQIKKERDDQVAQAAEQTEMKMLVSERVSFLQRSLAASRAIAQ